MEYVEEIYKIFFLAEPIFGQKNIFKWFMKKVKIF